jgi:hypothetical protein
VSVLTGDSIVARRFLGMPEEHNPGEWRSLKKGFVSGHRFSDATSAAGEERLQPLTLAGTNAAG